MAIRFDQPRSLAIELNFDGQQPNLFSAAIATARPMQAGEFVGSTQQGGSCNVAELQLNPHCNGTHTETVGHIVNESVPIHEVLTGRLLTSAVISVRTQTFGETGESYDQTADLADQVISAAELSGAIDFSNGAGRDALIIRTLPNRGGKRVAEYGPGAVPAYLTYEAIQLITRMNFHHLLIDTPSIDRIFDRGRLLNHHLFWNVEEGTHTLTDQVHRDRTVTEMIFVADDLIDGVYVLNLQVPAFSLDVAPSRPIIYPMVESR